MKTPILLSVVVPLRNSGRNVREMVLRLADTIAPLVSDYEIILVDNGSTDVEFAEYLPLLEQTGVPNVQLYRLISEVGYEVAAWAGVENSLGDYVSVHDPLTENLSRLPEAIEMVTGGVDIVYLRHTGSTDRGVAQQIFGSGFRWLFRKLTSIDLNRDATLGRLLSKRVVSYLMQQPRPDLRFRALPSLSGFTRRTLATQLEERRQRTDRSWHGPATPSRSLCPTVPRRCASCRRSR